MHVNNAAEIRACSFLICWSHVRVHAWGRESECMINPSRCCHPSRLKIGFGSCFAFGMLISFLSTLQMAKPTSFGLLYTLGNIVSVMATGFLIGPKRQLKGAFEKKRALATVIFIISMIGTLVAALYWKITIVVIIFIIFQFCALVWYTASYIPFAQSFITSTLQACCRRGA